jgi:pectin methylesterase-like acyl-CoA thioesterase
MNNTRGRSKVLLPLMALAAALFTVQVSAATLNVCASGCQYSTIQSAIDHAANKDVVFIEKGHYFETLNTRGKTLTLQGASVSSPLHLRHTLVASNHSTTSGGGIQITTRAGPLGDYRSLDDHE